MGTDIYCEKCQRQLDEGDVAITKEFGTVEPLSFLAMLEGYQIETGDGPPLETVCQECDLKRSQPNRIVVDINGMDDIDVRAERGNIVVIVRDHGDTQVFDELNIGELGVVDEPWMDDMNDPGLDWEELVVRAEEDHEAHQEELRELYAKGMGR